MSEPDQNKTLTKEQALSRIWYIMGVIDVLPIDKGIASTIENVKELLLDIAYHIDPKGAQDLQ